MKRLLLSLLLFWQLSALAQAPAPSLETAFLRDPQAQLSLDDVLDAEFQPYKINLNLGFNPGAAWIRLKIDAAEPGQHAASKRRVVRVGPNNLERIELHERVNGQWRRQVRGALTPENSRACPDDMHCFEIETPDSEITTLYFRVAHNGFLFAQIEVLPTDALPHAVSKRVQGLTSSLVMAIGLLAVGLVLLVADRSLLLLVYCGFQLTVVLFISSNAGLIARAFPDIPGEPLNLINHMLYVLRCAMTGLLAWAVLRPHGTPRLHKLGGNVLFLMCALNAFLIPLGHVQLALKTSLLLLTLIPFWHLYGTLFATGLAKSHRRVLVLGTSCFIVLLALGLLLAFGSQGIAPKTGLIRLVADWRLNGLAVGLLLFLITIMEREDLKRVRARDAESLRQHALEASAQEAKLGERTGLIDMLTHELKNPLSTIRFAVASLRNAAPDANSLKRIQSIDLSARRMDDLIERVASLSKVERAATQKETSAVDVAEMIHELLADMPRPQQWNIRAQQGTAVNCDRYLLWAILENLMSNAEKYSFLNHEVTIRVALQGVDNAAQKTDRDGEADKPMVCVEISNAVDPAAIPDEASLFERYYRHPSVQGIAGMGLGLSIVKSAVQKIRGEIAYRYERGQVVFTLKVPA